MKRSGGLWSVVIFSVIGLLIFGFTQWRNTVNEGGQVEAEPFRIAGNFYYVGAADATAFLLTGPDGHILIDAGYSGSTPMIMASLKKLGFKIHDVKAILNSDPHSDRAGGLAALQDSSGAKLYASELNADVLASGGANDPSVMFLPMEMFRHAGVGTYTAPRVDGKVKDGDTVRVGALTAIAHITGGHSPGCTTWTFSIHDGNRDLNAVSVCDLELPPGASLKDPQKYPGIESDYEHTFTVLRSLPVDIFVTAHAKDFGRYRKFEAQASAENPADPFIDPAGYRAYVDSAEQKIKMIRDS